MTAPKWVPRASKTVQELGRIREGDVLRRYGARPHPGSGSGKIQFDGSNEDDVYEIKHAAQVFSVQRRYVARLFKAANDRGKNARLVLVFPGYTVEMLITRNREL